MDSLIVLRRPLRKAQVESKFIRPKKSKKAPSKLAPIPPSPECTQPSISFVKLYEEACVEHARRSAPLVLPRQPSRELLYRPSRELLQRPSHELLYRPSRELLHRPSRELLHRPSRELLHRPSRELLHRPSRELLHRPSRELLHRPSLAQLSAEWPQQAPALARRQLTSLASLVTQYPGRRLHGPPPSRAAGAELVLELDYDSRSKDSAFASTRNSSF